MQSSGQYVLNICYQGLLNTIQQAHKIYLRKQVEHKGNKIKNINPKYIYIAVSLFAAAIAMFGVGPS